MTNLCRFCKTGKVELLFPAANKTQSIRAADFACSNCGYGVHGKIVHCPNCKITYVDEKLTQEKISAYYEVVEDPLYFAEQEARKKTFSGYLDSIEKLAPARGKLLDVGTNTGLFVKVAKDRGWETVGIEPSREAVSYAKKTFKVEVLNEPLRVGLFPEHSFDVITMWDVIEHFTDPFAAIETVRHYLAPGGLFAFTTVDPESPLAKALGTNWFWYMEMHRVFLSRKAAEKALVNGGFDKISFRPHWRSLSLGYLATRLEASNKFIGAIAGKIVRSLGLEKQIVPFYANDLYNCYAFLKK